MGIFDVQKIPSLDRIHFSVLPQRIYQFIKSHMIESSIVNTMSARGNVSVQFMAVAILLLTIVSHHVLFVESFVNPSDRHVSIPNSEASAGQVSPAYQSPLTTIIFPIQGRVSAELRRRRRTKLQVSGSVSSKSETTSSNNDEEKNNGKQLPSLFPKKTKKSSSSNSDQPTTPADDDENNGNAASKFRTLKDYMWRRDTLEDLAAAEFACSVEASDDNVDDDEQSSSLSSSSLEGNGGTTRRKRRAVDYEKLVTKLNKRIQDMLGGRRYIDENGRALGGQTLSIVKGRGMGRVVYTEAQRTRLLK